MGSLLAEVLVQGRTGYCFSVCVCSKIVQRTVGTVAPRQKPRLLRIPEISGKSDLTVAAAVLGFVAGYVFRRKTITSSSCLLVPTSWNVGCKLAKTASAINPCIQIRWLRDSSPRLQTDAAEYYPHPTGNIRRL